MRLQKHLAKPALCLASALALCAGLASVGANAADDGFTPLFNGTDLSGWTGDPKLWSVENGEIVGATNGIKLEKNTFLSTEKSYSDFVLKVKVKLINHNSGIQFRSEQLPDFGVKGYQADVAEETYFGMLYEEQGRGILPYWNEYTDDERAAVFAAAKLDDWNAYEITCQGDHVKIVLNGYTTLDFNDPEGAKSGIIALQLHTGPDMKALFKDIEIKELGEKKALKEGELMPDAEAREARLAYLGERFRLPEGFSLEEVANHDLLGSVTNFTFDHLGRPVVGAQDDGVRILLDKDGNGKYESQQSFNEDVKRIMGMHFIAPGDLLVQGEGPQGPGLYRLTDTDGDDIADLTDLLMPSQGGVGEHGPHAIVRGFDGYIHLLYGHQARPASPLDPATANVAPGGTLLRVDPEFKQWARIAGGFHKAHDLDIDQNGEILTFDSDTDGDMGLPWFRPARVVHAIPGGDYGWRTGSSVMPAYYIDTLPSVDDVGRGSPGGVCFYEHDAFPPEYRGAFFIGDWSRGRIRVCFPKAAGATLAGEAQDFVVGEPLNVTDLNVSPVGDLYFSVGGGGTPGGLYRIRYGQGGTTPKTPSTIAEVLAQPMPRSAWSRHAIARVKEALGENWTTELTAVLRNTTLADSTRVRALELLQVHGPRPETALLSEVMRDASPALRAAAVLLMGCGDLKTYREPLINALYDKDPVVARRACEALVRVGLNESTRVDTHEGLISGLYLLLDHEDRFVRYAARTAMERMHRDLWSEYILSDEIDRRPRGVMEGTLALIETQRAAVHADGIFAHLDTLSQAPMEDAIFLDFLRVAQLAFLRDVTGGDRIGTFKAQLGARMLAKFPHGDAAIDRELQTLIAYLQPPGSVDELLAHLTRDTPQEDQIHTMYALCAIESGWTPETRARAVAWFDRGREMKGGAGMEGYINKLWDALMERLPEMERVMAQDQKNRAMKKREDAALALLAKGEVHNVTDLAQMSFEALAGYLEYHPLAYTTPSHEEGQKVFMKARCANCHVFGTHGKGGGPDLSTFTSRARRKDILEAIMYPAKVVSDQYPGAEVQLDDLNTVTGMVAGEDAKSLTLITTSGEPVEIPKKSIVKRTVLTQSMMPEGLLNTMNLQELVSLIDFLEHGAEE